MKNKKISNVKDNRNIKGITLIALVITIIVLLILAAVSIAMLTGENGILTKANVAKERTNEGSIKEDIKLTLLDWKSEEIEKGISIEGKEGITQLQATMKYNSGVITYITKEGEKYTIKYENDKLGNLEKENSGEKSQEYKAKHPEEHIPTGFWYTTGTVNTGYVITDGTNEFVWIPVENSTRYIKKSGGYNRYTTAFNENVSKKIEEVIKGDALGVNNILGTNVQQALADKPEAQIVNNAGGFWVGRYEAGIENEGHNNIAGVTSVTGNDNNTNILNNYWESKKSNIVTKQNTEPVRNITQEKALQIANNWKKGEASSQDGKVAFQSGLITGTQWDVICEYIGWSECDTNCATWGNYLNVASQKLEVYHSGNGNSEWKKETVTKGTNDAWVYPTGKFIINNNSDTAKKNIYDIAGNVWEWTTEVPQINDGNSVIRGGSAYGGRINDTANFRDCNYSTQLFTTWNLGFRIVLYVE